MTYSISVSGTPEYRAGGPNQETVDDVREARVTETRVTETKDTPPESARDQIIRAAARQFSVRPYHLVSLDDILAEAEVTKGAMYFHFESKYALAVVIIERYAELGRTTVREQIHLQRSALETLIDISYLMAVQDVTQDTARAGVHLLDAIGRMDNLHANQMSDWITTFGDISRRAVEEGDILTGSDPLEISHLLVSLYAGLRQTTAFQDAGTLLVSLEKSWILVLPGFVDPSRVAYFSQLVRRRTRVALKKL